MKIGDELLAEAMKLKDQDAGALKAFFNNLTPEEKEAMRERAQEHIAEMAEAWENILTGFRITLDAFTEFWATIREALVDAEWVEDGGENEQAGETDPTT